MSLKRIALALLALAFVSRAQAQAPSAPGFASASVAFGSVTGSFATFLAGGRSFVDLDVMNNTDAAIRCSWDAGTTYVVIPAYSSFSPTLGGANRFISTATQCRHNGAAPTVGTVDVFGVY